LPNEQRNGIRVIVEQIGRDELHFFDRRVFDIMNVIGDGRSGIFASIGPKFKVQEAHG
jgi:hypothetical protein